MKELIEKHFEQMVEGILGHYATYQEALDALRSVTSCSVPNFGAVANSLKEAIKKEAVKQKTPNHKD